jgi:hypothetical protein
MTQMDAAFWLEEVLNLLVSLLGLAWIHGSDLEAARY